MAAQQAKATAPTRGSGFTYEETYRLYDEQLSVCGRCLMHCTSCMPRLHLLMGEAWWTESRLRSHYARATYTTEQLDRWQTDWNNYFVQYGMEIPVYAHKVRSACKPTPSTQHGGSLRA